MKSVRRLFSVIRTPLCVLRTSQYQVTSKPATLITPRALWFRCGHSDSQKQEEDMDDLQKNPYFAKYADKLKKLQEASPTEFDSKLDSLQQTKEREKEMKKKDAEQQKAELLAKQKEAQSKSSVSYKKSSGLDDIMKVDLLKDKTGEEIGKIWKEHHLRKDCIFGVVQAGEYDVLYERSQECPMFIYPLPRDDGYEFILGQFQGHECHFTPLISYQVHKENSPVCFVIKNYPEFKDDKGIVLMRGELDADVIQTGDAVLLVKQMQMYYGPKADERFELVKKMNKSPEQFQHMDVIAELDKIM